MTSVESSLNEEELFKKITLLSAKKKQIEKNIDFLQNHTIEGMRLELKRINSNLKDCRQNFEKLIKIRVIEDLKDEAIRFTNDSNLFRFPEGFDTLLLKTELENQPRRMQFMKLAFKSPQFMLDPPNAVDLMKALHELMGWPKDEFAVKRKSLSSVISQLVADNDLQRVRYLKTNKDVLIPNYELLEKNDKFKNYFIEWLQYIEFSKKERAST